MRASAGAIALARCSAHAPSDKITQVSSGSSSQRVKAGSAPIQALAVPARTAPIW
jgi:hypothetical protein